MRSFLTGAAVLAATLTNVAYADLCALGSSQIAGNWYCQPVNTIQYQNFGSSGTYQKVTHMDPASGTCASHPVGFSGSLAPLNDEVSFHIRGPTILKQFAAYQPGSGAAKKVRRSTPTERRAAQHAHEHVHKRDQDEEKVEKRGVGTWVTAVINGQTVSWVNEYSGKPTAAPKVPSPAAPPRAGGHHRHKHAAVGHPAVHHHLGGHAPAPAQPVSAPAGDWAQIAYYDSASGTATGLTFLNNKGGQGSGVFDYTFGNSLSYASSDGCSGAASSTVLADVTIPSVEEISIWTDQRCQGGCNYTRPGTVAYHGFGGSQKLFLIEFQMPDDGGSGSMYSEVNQPALWLLNAQVPRTLQYGPNPGGSHSCSCWPDCGEFDLFETLSPGSTMCKSTLHANVAGGDSDYFERPATKPIKAAIVMDNYQATIKVLDDTFNFAQTLSGATVNAIVQDVTNAAGSSIFTLG